MRDEGKRKRGRGGRGMCEEDERKKAKRRIKLEGIKRKVSV